MNDRIVSGNLNDEDSYSEGGLRPRRLTDYVGQDKVKENLITVSYTHLTLPPIYSV